MTSPRSDGRDVVVTGLGVTTAVGQGKDDFVAALLDGRHAFGFMQRPGRLPPAPSTDGSAVFLGAEIGELSLPGSIAARSVRTASLSARAALATLYEAWHEAGLDDADPSRIGLVVGGSNVQQRELTLLHARHADRPEFLRPTYGMGFMDSDLCGFCTEQFPIRGFAHTLGGASASGLLAVLQAVRAVQSGEVDVCIALGALMDLSYWECLAFQSMGAMGSHRWADDPAAACRPFDRNHDGFIFGEACAAVVVERADGRRHPAPYARFRGGGRAMDGTRNPHPSVEGEVAVIQAALREAGLTASAIDYVNAHGTGSPTGDAVELRALARCGLTDARINATKSITGHGLTAAGAVEIVATLLQMREQKLHPTRNLVDPLDETFPWVREKAEDCAVRTAVSLSMGFGGVSAAICLEKC
ncbi:MULTISPECIES: beta-ketoacyl synthase N-terminal-like domain-containing protein [unclassified Streptomyces]|uniref:beta-ketoacyl synthase N-terminal-like domain-containing protein n=1 Tax=unclassified Streptomyces TaxID=2593676 RepID=UPI001BE92F8C|nr:MULTISPECIES: beta-ketoacyl synthase N-terminal-like domain-containing protein [unclassified Streptomyces]MBT2404433.1 polyketide beta-ketoacyl:ACP synthase [Streptomyces sp. ISL-21]MBT2459208.1 polyketide beta-ketoacyl:ACP synthase [Streptomyces sp. ISL-86]MBT2612513.1 polyketide beta-ketoacyl:ACP synthase [Streptomyces sp. ISL-87]